LTTTIRAPVLYYLAQPGLWFAFTDIKRKGYSMYSVCDECRELWRQYSVVSATHLQLENKLRLAALENAFNLIPTLTVETEGAERNRNNLRELIHKHEAAHSISAARARIHRAPVIARAHAM
jgi:hypothetical protein